MCQSILGFFKIDREFYCSSIFIQNQKGKNQMAKANRICYTDNKPYYYCPSCPSEEKKEAFYNMFCCERCSKIFKLLTDETFKHITTEQCKNELIALGVDTEDVFKDGIQTHIQKVLNYEAPAKFETKDNTAESEVKYEMEAEVKKNNYVSKKEKVKIVK